MTADRPTLDDVEALLRYAEHLQRAPVVAVQRDREARER